jgi:hypothetical protein
LLVRKPGGNHFNGAERGQKQLDRKRMGRTLKLDTKTAGRFLQG